MGEVYGVKPKRRARMRSRSMWNGSLTSRRALKSTDFQHSRYCAHPIRLLSGLDSRSQSRCLALRASGRRFCRQRLRSPYHRLPFLRSVSAAKPSGGSTSRLHDRVRARSTGEGLPAYCAAPSTTIACAGRASSRLLHMTTADIDTSQTAKTMITATVNNRRISATTRLACAAALAAARFACVAAFAAVALAARFIRRSYARRSASCEAQGQSTE